jgi:uncharacterized protein (TIGR03083 family)
VNDAVTDAGRWADHVSAIRSDTERMAAAFEAGPVDAPVAACPGWDVRKLIEHMAYIHRWAGFAVRNGRAPEAGEVAVPADSADTAEMAAWLRAGGTALADDLATADPQADTWHVFPAPKKMWVWGRRQAQETSMHRWDAEMATFGSSSLDATRAAEGVQEYLELGLPRVLSRGEGVNPPGSTLHVGCTDVPGDWTITSSDGQCIVIARSVTADGNGDTADAGLVGTAESLILVLMGRADRATIDIVGDARVADEWLSLPGW